MIIDSKALYHSTQLAIDSHAAAGDYKQAALTALGDHDVFTLDNAPYFQQQGIAYALLALAEKL